MGRYFLLMAALLLFAKSHAFERVTFNVSKPLCLLTFLQAASGAGSVAPALSDYVMSHISGKDSIALRRMANEFSQIGFRFSYVFPGYPERRQVPKTVADRITIAAVQSKTMDEFFGRITGALPNEQWLKLKKIMADAEPVYNKMIGKPFKAAIQQQLEALNKYNTRTDGVFNKLKRFYCSTWGDDMSFTISMYPVPGNGGTTTATPHSNSVVLAVLTGRKEYAGSVAVAVHEICHVLYQEQPLPLQLTIDSLFLHSSSGYRLYAYNFIDEALATTCGNGWAYKALSGHMDTSSWYNDKYIDGFAHAIYPMVAGYIENGRALDKEFVDKAIILFGQTFPEAIYDYQVMLNRVNLYTDAETDAQYQQVTSALNRYFQVSGCAGAYPITDPQALDMIGQTTNTQLFVVYTNHQKNYDALKAKFPQMKDMQPGQEGIVSFLDENKRPIILVNVRNLERVETGIRKLAATGTLAPGRMFVPIE